MTWGDFLEAPLWQSVVLVLTGLPHITGTRGDTRVEAVLANVRLAADSAVLELTAASLSAEAKSLREAYRSFVSVREQRLSYRELLPGSLVVVLVICSVCTLVDRLVQSIEATLPVRWRGAKNFAIKELSWKT